MEADPRILNVFLQRHVSHHSHGAEAFRRILYGAVDRLGGEYGDDDGERQIRETAVGKGIGMIRRPGRLPDRSARDFEPDHDLGELCADRLMLDEWPPALHAQPRVIECGLVGGASDAESERLFLRDAPAMIGEERSICGEKILRRNAAMIEYERATGAVLPVLTVLACNHGQARCIARDE